MGELKVLQRTKDSMFNATYLLKQWNDVNKSNKEIASYFKMKSTIEFIETMEDDTELLHMAISPYVKSKASRGKNAGTWMHPYLFIDFAMWINPKFKLNVIKFVYDQLIKERHSAGDNYRLLSSSGPTLSGYQFAKVATALNYIVFNKKGKNLRNTASEEELQELSQLQTNLAFAIDKGYISTYTQLISELKKHWSKKYLTNPISA